jgi:hypothetical protein
MTSAINFSTIDENYPVAGIDNNSQGFRDNFNEIKTALATASSEITTLQTKAVLKSNLTSNAVVTNDLAGSSIVNGVHNKFYGVSYTPTNAVTTTTDIDVESGVFQAFTMGADVSFTFRNWPDAGKYASVRVLLSTNNTALAPRRATFYSQGQTTSTVFKAGNSGLAPNGWLFDTVNPYFNVVASWTKVTTAASPATAASITVNDVSNLQIGTRVSYVPTGGGTTITTISAINSNTGVITLANAVATGGIESGDTITFLYNGPRLIEAFTWDGGDTVYLTQVADF